MMYGDWLSLIEQGRIVACAPVIGELRDAAVYVSRPKTYEHPLQAGDHNSDDAAYLQQVGGITHDPSGMSKATGWKTPDDPYLVALAELEKYVVVADESKQHRIKHDFASSGFVRSQF